MHYIRAYTFIIIIVSQQETVSSSFVPWDYYGYGMHVLYHYIQYSSCRVEVHWCSVRKRSQDLRVFLNADIFK